MADRSSRCTRRRWLATSGAAVGWTLAGCLGDGGGSGDETDGDGETGDSDDAASDDSRGSADEEDDESSDGELSVDGEWRHLRNDPAASGFAPDVAGPQAAVEQLWTADSPGTHPSYPCVDDGTVFVYCQGTARALDAETGSEQWRTEVESSSGIRVAVGDDALFVGGTAVHALDPDDGEQLWRYDERGILPVVRDGQVYLSRSSTYNDDQSGVQCLDAETGAEQWFADLPAALDLPVVGPSGSVFGLDADNVVRAIDPDGSRRWSYDLDILRRRNGVALGDDRLFVTNGEESTVLALDPDTGEELWTTDVICNDVPAYDGEYVYTADLLGNVRKLDPASGSVVDGWEEADFGYTNGSPVVTTDSLYVAGYESTDDDAPEQIIAVDKADGTENWRVDVGQENFSNVLAVVEDVLYFSTSDRVHAMAAE